jgi:hypothetical protein
MNGKKIGWFIQRRFARVTEQRFLKIIWVRQTAGLFIATIASCFTKSKNKK